MDASEVQSSGLRRFHRVADSQSEADSSSPHILPGEPSSQRQSTSSDRPSRDVQGRPMPLHNGDPKPGAQVCSYCAKPRETKFSPEFLICKACRLHVAHPQCIPKLRARRAVADKIGWICTTCYQSLSLGSPEFIQHSRSNSQAGREVDGDEQNTRTSINMTPVNNSWSVDQLEQSQSHRSSAGLQRRKETHIGNEHDEDDLSDEITIEDLIERPQASGRQGSTRSSIQPQEPNADRTSREHGTNDDVLMHFDYTDDANPPGLESGSLNQRSRRISRATEHARSIPVAATRTASASHNRPHLARENDRGNLTQVEQDIARRLKEQHRAEVLSERKKIEKLEQQLFEMRKDYAHMKGENSSLKTKANTLRIKSVQEKYQVQEEVRQLRTEVSGQKSHVTEQSKAMEGLLSRIDSLERDQRELDDEKQTLREGYRHAESILEERIKGLEEELVKALSENGKLRDSNDTLKQRLQQNRSRKTGHSYAMIEDSITEIEERERLIMKLIKSLQRHTGHLDEVTRTETEQPFPTRLSNHVNHLYKQAKEQRDRFKEAKRRIISKLSDQPATNKKRHSGYEKSGSATGASQTQTFQSKSQSQSQDSPQNKGNDERSAALDQTEAPARTSGLLEGKAQALPVRTMPARKKQISFADDVTQITEDLSRKAARKSAAGSFGPPSKSRPIRSKTGNLVAISSDPLVKPANSQMDNRRDEAGVLKHAKRRNSNPRSTPEKRRRLSSNDNPRRSARSSEAHATKSSFEQDGHEGEEENQVSDSPPRRSSSQAPAAETSLDLRDMMRTMKTRKRTGGLQRPLAFPKKSAPSTPGGLLLGDPESGESSEDDEQDVRRPIRRTSRGEDKDPIIIEDSDGSTSSDSSSEQDEATTTGFGQVSVPAPVPPRRQTPYNSVDLLADNDNDDDREGDDGDDGEEADSEAADKPIDNVAAMQAFNDFLGVPRRPRPVVVGVSKQLAFVESADDEQQQSDRTAGGGRRGGGGGASAGAGEAGGGRTRPRPRRLMKKDVFKVGRDVTGNLDGA